MKSLISHPALPAFAAIAIISALIGALSALFLAPALGFSGQEKKTQNELIAEYYEVENAVKVSPHGLRTKMVQGVEDFILVDLRSAEEYDKAHVVGAINIPAYSNKDTPAYHETDRIISAFKALPPGKEVIVYCYSIPCMTGRKIGKMLAHEGVFVKHLGIGWNEWRYDWQGWNHEHEWSIYPVEDFLAQGPAPGAYAKVNTSAKSFCGPVEVGC